LAVAVVLAAAAVGCDSHRAATRRKHVSILRLSCAHAWVPTALTFKGYRAWRATSIRIGPITLMGAKAAARRDVAAIGNVKFRTLVRPQTGVTVTIADAARSAVGFVAPLDAEHSIWPAHGAAILKLAPCAANYPRTHGVLAVGYPMYLRVRRNVCALVTVEDLRRGLSTERKVAIGVRRCRS
jgi:hypothetical protein